MFKKLGKLIGGDTDRRELERYSIEVARINALEPVMQALSDEALHKKTDEFRLRLSDGETLDSLLPEAFAVVREVSIRTIGLRHFNVQLIGGMLLHEGRIAEMKTGEGKTLAATLPLYLNTLEGKGAHLVTVNDYLARRDARWMGPIYHFLGISVGILQAASRTENGHKAFLYDPSREKAQEDINQLQMVDRKQAYAADVTYGTNNEFGFDYLRDNMAQTIKARCQRGHHYAILDEVDNILIDEARTPLIISGPSHEDPEMYYRMTQVIKPLRLEDYEISERDRTVTLTEIGENHVEQLLGMPLRDPDRPEDITPEQARMLGFLEQALRAEFLFKRNKDYVVQGGKVLIVDEFTGRLMVGRRWSDGLHQAVEAKEGVRVRRENVTYATVTLQNFFRMYEKLAGMTGTAVTEAEEFNKIYNVDVFALPTNIEHIAMQPDSDLVEVEYREDGNKFTCFCRRDDQEKAPIFWRRKDYADSVYRTEEAKLRAIVTEILRKHVIGQPMLVGTASVELSERLSARLRAEPLQRLANILILRDAYLEAHGIPDNGMRVAEIEPLYQPLKEINNAILRPFAREVELSLNPTRPNNLDRLTKILGLGVENQTRLTEVIQGGIRHSVLNAKKHAEESAIIAGAGALGAVTIATNMAGRGVDIKLGGEIAEEVLAAANRVLRRSGVIEPERMSMEERLVALDKLDRKDLGIYEAEIELFRKYMADEKRVKEVGGLHVVGSERHDARRIDNQLRGRAARQGDIGSSQFFLSLEDDLMRLFGGSQVAGMMQRLNIDDAMPIAHSMVDRTIEQAQTRVEGANFDTRKHLLEYDDVLNQQREVFYGQRNRAFLKDDLSEDIAKMLEVEAKRHVDASLEDPEGPWKLLAWLEEIQPTIHISPDKAYPSFMLRLLLDELKDVNNENSLRAALIQTVREALEAQYTHLAQAVEMQLQLAIDRLDDQANQNIELAEMAIDGLILEAEESGSSLDVPALMAAIERVAGLRIQLDSDSTEQIQADPDRLRRMLPQLIEASLGIRVWKGMVQAIERRVGESLGLENKLSTPIDWDHVSNSLQEALKRTWQKRILRMEEDVGRDLDTVLTGNVTITESLKLRLLVQMSYGRRTVFDRKTHQRRSLTVARFSYAFSGGIKLSDLGLDSEVLNQRVLEHLHIAQDNLQRALGMSEVMRLANNRLNELDESIKASLERSLGSEAFAEIEETAPIGKLPEEMQNQVAIGLGSSIMAFFYRRLFLSVGDKLWVDYLTRIEALRTSIGLEAYGQRDPLVQYKSQAFDMFQHLLEDIRAGVVSRMFRAQQSIRAPRESAATGRKSEMQAGATSKASQQKQKSKKRRKRRRR
jgi:preprotein translocase subunit SecA